jgi:hypothetical protein
MPGQGLEGWLSDEPEGVFSRQHRHFVTKLTESTHQPRSFIGCNSAGYSEQNSQVRLLFLALLLELALVNLVEGNREWFVVDG